MDILVRTYRITESTGRTLTVRRSDAFITKLCMGVVGGGFSQAQAREAEHLRQELLSGSASITRNGCTIRLIAGDIETLHVGDEVVTGILH